MSRLESRASPVTKAASASVAMMLFFLMLPGQSVGNADVATPTSDPPGPKPLDTKAQIESLLMGITSDLLRDRVQDLENFKTRYSYRGDQCFRAAEYVATCFGQNGLEITYQDFAYGGYSMRNIIGQKTGTATPENIYIICAHYDSTSTLAWSQAPGADDNGSGTAAVMAAAEILSDHDFNCTIRFIAFGGEELGLKGSISYFNRVIGLGENICGVMNLDMLAFNPDPGMTEVYVGKDFGDQKAVSGEQVYGPAPAGDTTVQMWLDHTTIINCNLYIQEQGTPGIYRKLVQGSPGDYLLNLSTGFIDLSAGIGPLSEYENITGWYNYSPAGFLIDYTKGVMQRYSNIFTLTPVDMQSGSSDHAPFSPSYPAIMLIERRYASNPNYHKTSDVSEYLNFTYCANVTQAAVATVAELAGLVPGDNAPPAHGPGFPPDCGWSTATPRISIDIRDPSSLDLAALTMRINGTAVVPVLSPIPLGYNVSYTPPLPYPDGAVINVSVSASDVPGNGFNHSWEFTVDAVPPEPPTNFTLSKSAIELKKRGLALNVGTTFDSKYAQSPSVVFKDGEYKMWYAANNGTSYHVCYASSTDGMSWTKYGIVLYKGVIGQPDSQSATYPTVIFDGEYKMWYSGSDGINTRIMYANSTDGITWVKRGVVLDVGAPGEMDSKWAYFPCVIKTDEYKMWYSGMDGLSHRVLYANSSNGLNWTKYSGDITPVGAGVVYGDAMVWSPEVVFHNGTYHMYCGRYDGLYIKTVYSVSQDGLAWNEMGLAIDTGGVGSYDFYRAEQCSIMMSDYVTKVWYSAYDGANWRIMFANITPQDTPKDLTLSWTPSSSPDVVGYEVYRESRPTAFREPMETATPEYYSPPAGQTPWAFEADREANLTVHSPTSGFIPQRFYLPDDNILNIGMCIELSNGSWLKFIQGSDFTLDAASGYVEVYSGCVESGSTIHAWYNHSAGRALRMTGSSMADIRAGVGSNKSYYYLLKAVDRAGNSVVCTEMPAKMGAQLTWTWNLVCGPLIEGQIQIDDMFEGLEWVHARTWEPERWPHEWTSNRPGSESNTLQSTNSATGVWVKISTAGAFATVGKVVNVTINLTAGWNLVSYPYHDIRTVSDALAGVPWDHVDVMDQASPGMLRALIGSDLLRLGQGFWVHMTSDWVWNAVNVP